MRTRKVFLYGPPGSGKSSLGRVLAAQLQLNFVDLDEWIETRSGFSIADIFENKGEAAFRQLEKTILNEIAALPGSCVVALGGGALLDLASRSLVEKTGDILCLQAEYDILLSRLLKEGVERPLIKDDLPLKLKTLLEQRSSHYQSFETLDVGALSIEKAVERAQCRLGWFHVSGMGSGYDVLVQLGLLTEVGPYFAQYGLKGPVVVVSDHNVAAHYRKRVVDSLEQAGYKTVFVALSPGEAHKTIESVQTLWQAFVEAGLERGSTVLALGGGVVGDLAGFAAATFKRGVSWVACPTSLLAMVDAGLGGKTGVDLPAGKNLVGAFHAPRLVLVDTDCLATLPEVELQNGMAEVIKHGLIADPDLFELCRQDWQQHMPRNVVDAMAVKIKIICEDPLEKGRREVLNLGHTVGHALELVSGFQLKHGEAVALGMLAEAQLAEEMGITLAENLVKDIHAALVNNGLPVSIPAGIDLDAVMQAMLQDKKRAAGVLRFALPMRIGEAKEGIVVEPHLVGSVLSRLQGK